MLKQIFILLLLLVSINSRSQELNINTLENILDMNNWEEVNRYFYGTKWKYHNKKVGASESEIRYTWSFGMKSYSLRASAWLSLYTIEDTPELIGYNFFEKDLYYKFRSKLRSSPYVKIDKVESNGKTIELFKGPNVFIRLVIDESDKDSSGFVKPKFYLLMYKKAIFWRW